jgi:hypothetical protein
MHDLKHSLIEKHETPMSIRSMCIRVGVRSVLDGVQYIICNVLGKRVDHIMK